MTTDSLTDINSGAVIPRVRAPRTVALFFFPQIEPALQNRIAEACIRFTPQVAVRKNEAIFLEISRCKNLYTEEALIRRIQSLIKRFDPLLIQRTRIAFAQDAATALACARHQMRHPERLPLEAFSDYLSPFKFDQELTKKCATIFSSLHKLGIQNLGQFIQLPLRSLPSRFSKEGLRISERVRMAFHEGLGDAWPVFHPPEIIEEFADLFQVETLDACNTQEILLFALRPALERLAARLHARGLRVTALELRFELLRRVGQSLTERSWRIDLPLPQGGARGLFQILRDRLGNELSQNPLAAPVNRLHLKIVETMPGAGAQKDFFHHQEEEVEDFSSLVSRLTAKLGALKVFHAELVSSHRPEAAWQKTLKPWKDKSMTPKGLTLNRSSLHSLFSERPNRLLKKPVKLVIVGDWLITNEAQNETENRWQAFEWSGPERVSGEWWERREDGRSGFKRDYYRVTSINGEQLWVYQTPQDEFFLHGYFD